MLFCRRDGFLGVLLVGPALPLYCIVLYCIVLYCIVVFGVSIVS